MKKLIAFLLAMIMCLSLVACGNQDSGNDQQAENPALSDAIAYVKTVYKKAATQTPKDFERIGTVPVGDEKFEVVWTADVSEDLVKIVKNENGTVTIDVNEESKEEVSYTLTATITDASGKSESASFSHVLPAKIDSSSMTPAQIVDLAYSVEDGVLLEETFQLTGVISSVDTAWSPDYQNITVTIKVAGKESQPIQCYRLKGEGADKLAVGDTITVEGQFTNYKGTIEFNAGCVLLSRIAGSGATEPAKPDMPVPTGAAAIVDAAYTLADGEKMADNATLTGKISAVDTAWNDQYGNITVTIKVSGKEAKPIMCYRLKGDGAKDLAVGDTITVTGILKNYKGTVEFDAGCTLDKVVKGSGSTPAPTPTPTPTPDPAPAPTPDPAPAPSASGFVTPAAGKTYKFAMNQANAGKILYFTGKMDGYYLATSSNIADAVDVTIEAVDGGLRFYFMSNGEKTYIDVIPRDTDPSKVNVVLTKSPTAVYTWNAEKGTLLTTVGSETWYLGTYGTYVTFSASKVSYIDDTSKIGVSQFPSGFWAV